jgi:hypothetical protein
MSAIITLLLFLFLLYIAWKLLKGMLYLAFFAIVGIVVLGFALHTGLLPGSTPTSAGGVLTDARQWAVSGASWLLSVWQRAHG